MTSGRGKTLITLACALLAALVVLLAPAAAQATPTCPPAATMPDVHSGASETTQVFCDDPSGTGLNWTPSDDAEHGFVIYDGNGGVTYYADFDYAGPDSWTAVVDDNEGGSTQIHFSVEVVNELPVCQDVAIETVHSQQGWVGADCEDPDGDAITIHANPAAHGTSGEDFGQLSYDPASGFTGSDLFTYYASDYVGDGATAKVNVTVTDTPPECSSEFVPFDQTLRTGKPIQLQVSCFDVDGDAVTVDAASDATHGTLGSFAYNPNSGTFEATYTPDPGYTGPDHFAFSADDGIASSPDYDFDLTVTENHAPECQQNGPVHARVNQQVTVFFFCSDTDSNDQDLTYSVVSGSGPNHGTLGTLGSLQVDYTPTSSYTGEDTFTIRASDGDLTDDYVQVLHVANTPFCSTPPPATVRSGRSRQLTVDCTVPDNDFGPSQYEVTSPPSQGSLSPAGTSVFPFRTYTADGNASGSDSYAIRLTGSTGSSPAVTQAITTGTGANNAPTCDNPFTQDVYANRPTTVFMFCSDADQDPISFTAGADPAHGTSSTVEGRVRYTADEGYTGPDEIPFTASDGHGGTTSGSWPVEVHAPEAPTCSPVSITKSVRPGRSVSLSMFCSNPQNDDQTYSLSGPAPSKGSLGSFDEAGGATYTAGSTAGTDSFQLKASNPVGDSAPVQVTITVDPDYNRAPQCFGFGTRAVASGVSTPLDLTAVCSDPDGDPMLFERRSNPAHGTVSAGPAATLDYQSAGGYTGSDSFSFVARDNRGAESPVATRFLDVRASIAPTCTAPPTLNARPGQSRAISLNCSDPNFEQLTYKIVAAPSGSLTPAGDSTSAFRQYTAPGTAGTDSFTFKVRNTSGLESAVYTQNVTIDPSANQAPTCSANAGFPQNVARNHPTKAEIAAHCVDGDGDPLTFTRSGATNPQHGATSEANGEITYTSSGTYTGLDSFSYTASDGHGGSVSGTFTVNVVNTSAPECQDVSRSTQVGTPVEVQLQCSDPDPTGTFTLSASGASHGTLGAVDPDTGEVTFTPDDGYAGPASFHYRATDDHNVQSDPATVSIDVEDNQPACSNVSATTTTGTPVEVSLSCTDADSGDTLTLSASGASHGSLGAVDQGTKKVVFTPDAGYVGSAGFSYKATDSHGVDSDPASAAITVNAAPGSGDPGGGSPGGGDPGGGDPGAGGPAPDTTPPTLSIAPLAKQKLAKVLKKGLGVTIGCSETCVASVKLTVAKKLAKKLGIASADVTLGSAKKTLGAGKRKLYVKLGAKARKRLKKARSVRLKLVLRATDAAGNAATRARTLTLKR